MLPASLRRGSTDLGFRCWSLMRPMQASVDLHFPDHTLLLRHFSSQLVKTNGNRAYLVDTLALVRRLEAQGLPTKQAEAITSTITEVLNDSLENVAQSFMSKSEMDKIEMVQESNLSKFKSEMKSTQYSLFGHWISISTYWYHDRKGAMRWWRMPRLRGDPPRGTQRVPHPA
ncbi:uncharacterized protein LOC122043293 [Zingiber officinale]|uniref:uncharacterized protein LOC122043293 n=1 Tax=Zingiber officinale TaxID=94328 RepID=UPI001C4BE065|nr:uncharacterized protein LOC122043293 [Zingiber officinale]